MLNNNLELLTDWLRRLKETQAAHYESSKPLAGYNLALGIPVVVLTAFVGTSVFATLEKDVEPLIKIAVGLISVTAAILSSLQTFLRFSERAEQHRSTAARSGVVRRQIEQLIAGGDWSNIPSDKIDKIRNEIDRISESAPSIKESVWSRVSEKIKKSTDSSAPITA